MLSLFRRKFGKKGSPRRTQNEKGQSFVELSLVVIFLMIFVAGVVEFGFMLNNVFRTNTEFYHAFFSVPEVRLGFNFGLGGFLSSLCLARLGLWC